MKITSLAYSRSEDDPKKKKNPDAVRPAPSPLGLAALGAGGGGSSSGSSGITVGTTTVTSGTAGRVLYTTAGNVVGSGPINVNALSATFLDVASAAAASGLALSVGSSGANESWSLKSKGTGILRVIPDTAGAGTFVIGSTTDTADAQLSVYSQSTTRPSLKLRALSGTAATQNAFESYDASGTLTALIDSSGNIRSGAKIYPHISGTNDWIDRSAGVNTMSFFTGGAEHLRIAVRAWTMAAYGSGLGYTIGTVSQGGVSNRAADPVTINVAGGSGNGAAGYFVVKAAPSLGSGTTGHTSEEALRVAVPATGVAFVSFNGVTSAFPALKRSSTSLAVRLADDSDDAPLTTLTVKTKALTVATLPAAVTAGAGARAFVTDANATTFLSTVAGGGANAVPVVSDGTNWLIG